ncbi:MAG: CDP-alcohol phosphatidyltransferase family protein [Oscillospiraceae bacterium]|nr:CDP-alcohol phosphatidyltransferase family protein [Oscillospiraceae bacterium]
MFVKDWKKDIFTIPNLLSLFRLLLIPVYVAIYLNAEDTTDYILAAGILTVSCLTDLIDGKIARHFNMITSLGKVLDPLADKATQFTLILCLTVRYKVLQYVMALFVLKESFQLIAGSLRLRKKKMLKGALISGKICTTVLFISLILMVMLPELSVRVVNAIALIDTVFLLVAFIEYVAAYFFMDSKFQSLDE